MWKDELKIKSFYANDNSIDRIKAFRDKQGWFPAVRLSEVEELIESLLKEQRESVIARAAELCDKERDKDYPDLRTLKYLIEKIDAPEPSNKEK